MYCFACFLFHSFEDAFVSHLYISCIGMCWTWAAGTAWISRTKSMHQRFKMSQTRIIMNTVSTLEWLIWIDFVLHSVWRTESQHCALCIDIYYQYLIEYDQFIFFISIHTKRVLVLQYKNNVFNAKIMFIFLHWNDKKVVYNLCK